MSLEETIAAAAEKAAVAQQEWSQKHHPVRIDGKTYWLSTEIPKDIQNTMDILPRDREKSDIKRTNQIKTRLSDEELEAFDLLVKTSGLPQGEYIRGMVLHGKVNITQTSYVDQQTLDTLTQLSATFGKLAGLMRQTVIVNKGFAVLTQEDKSYLEQQIKSMRRVQSAVQRTAEGLYNGRPRAAAALRDLRFVESQTVQPEDLTVIGHISDLLVVFTLSRVTTFYRQEMHRTTDATRVYSAADDGVQFPATALFNLSGPGVQPGAPHSRIFGATCVKYRWR